MAAIQTRIDPGPVRNDSGENSARGRDFPLNVAGFLPQRGVSSFFDAATGYPAADETWNNSNFVVANMGSAYDFSPRSASVVAGADPSAANTGHDSNVPVAAVGTALDFTALTSSAVVGVAAVGDPQGFSRLDVVFNDFFAASAPDAIAGTQLAAAFAADTAAAPHPTGWVTSATPGSLAQTWVPAPHPAAFINAGAETGPAVHLSFAIDGAPINIGPGAAAAARLDSPLAALASAAVEASNSPAAHLVGHGAMLDASVGFNGATPAQVQLALDESGLSVTGAGIKVGVLSDSFNDLGGAAADEADGALPPASQIQVLSDLSSGGTDEGRAMMQIVHDVAPGASLAFYTAFNSEQDFANGILALASAGCKVICDDVSYYDEPFFQNGVVAQAIQTVESEGVCYLTAAGNDASNAYQAAWTPISGTFDLRALTDTESFSGSLVQTITVTASTSATVPLLLEWNQAYGDATSDLEILVFRNGRLYGTATNVTSGESTNPWVYFDFTASGTYQIAIENRSGPNPALIKEIAAGDGLPVTISGANVGTIFGHAMTPGAITVGAVSSADTPAFGVNPALSETFSSSGLGTELLFANNGTALSLPDPLAPVAVSGVDDVNTTVPGGLSDFYGTSAATPSVAGIVALMLQANPNLTPAEVDQILQASALPMANSAVSGAGLAQAGPAIDTAILFVTSVAESPSTGDLNAGKTVTITLGLSETVTVTGTPTLILNDGGTATYTGGSGSSSLSFSYKVVATNTSVPSLAVSSVSLNGGTIQDGGGNSIYPSLTGLTQTGPQIDTTIPLVTSVSSLPSSGVEGLGSTVTLTLGVSEAVTVTGGTPTLALSDEAVATYDAAHSTTTAFVFDYTVSAGQYAQALGVTGVNLNGATIQDAAGNAAVLTGADTTVAGLQIDATTPIVTAVRAHDTLGSSIAISSTQTATLGVLAHDTDADPYDTLSVSAVAGQAGNVGSPVTGTYGTLILNADGSYNYSNTNTAAVTATGGGVALDAFNYTVSNGHGGTATSSLTIVITSPGQIYVGGTSGETLQGGTGNYVLDGGAGNDTLIAGTGTQVLIGGAGFDEAILPSPHSSFTTNTFNPQTGSGILAGNQQSDTLYGIQATAFIDLQHGGPFNPAEAQFADITGDGRADLIYQGVDNRFWLATASGNDLSEIGPQVMQHGGTFVAGEAQYADVTGDGKADLIYQGLNNVFWLATATGDGFNESNTPVMAEGGPPFQAGQAQYADVNGDGKADLIYQGANNVFWVALSNGHGFDPITTPAMAEGGPPFQAGEAQYADINGDGKADLIYQGVGNKFWVALSNGRSFDPITTPAASFGGTFVPGSAQYADINGDGKADLIFQDANNRFWVDLSNGRSFDPIATPAASFGGSFVAGSAHYADMNGDGKADLIFQTSNNEVWVATSNGTGFNKPQEIANFGGTFQAGDLHVVDINGDHLPDLVFETNQNQFEVSINHLDFFVV